MEFLTKCRLKRFLLAYTLKSMPIVYILVLGIVCILYMPISFSENASAWIGGYILAPILCIFVLRYILKDVKVLDSQLSMLEQRGELQQMLEDFRKAEKTIGGNLMVGQKYLFGKGSMHVVPYGAISRIHMVNAERKGKLARDLLYEDAEGQEYFVCQLDPMGQSHAELDRIYRLILKKNPSAETGL